ncbi:MAG: efflux RND transporter periplasmic adaptor subunit [Candidatus Acidiferrales bacterium]
MNRSGSILSVCLLAASVFSASCGSSPGGTRLAASQPAQPILQVEVTRVTSQKLDTTVKLPAQLTAYEMVDMYPKVTGFVKWIKVDRGSRVRQGEQIAQLDAPELLAQRTEAESKYQSAESQLAAAQAKLAASQATYRRTAEAAKTPGVVAPNDLETAQQTAQADSATVAADQKTAVAENDALQAVSELQGYLIITAPFDGEVTTRYVHPGALVGPQGGPGAAIPIVQIQTLTRQRLVVPVPEYDAASVPEGTEVAFTVPSFPGKIFHAPIARISHAVDLKTRTMPIELDVRDPRAQLAPGMFCQVEWPVRRAYPTLSVPVSAVGSDLERTFVVRVRQGKAEWVDVTTGMTVNGKIEVFGDLQAGDVVVANGPGSVPNGANVGVKAK